MPTARSRSNRLVATGCNNDEVAIVEEAEEVSFEDDDIVMVETIVGVTHVEQSFSFGFLTVVVAIATVAASTLPNQGIVHAAAETAGETPGGSSIGFTKDGEEELVVLG